MFRVLECFSGLGGWRYALGERVHIVAAYDISPAANATYEASHGECPHARELASIPAKTILNHGADTWVMSPPCQPFCRMGNRQDLEDARSKGFLRLMQIFLSAPPEHLLLENVTGFDGSDAHGHLCQCLRHCGFHWREWHLCPTHFGIPNQRPRFFLAASRRPIPTMPRPNVAPDPLSSYLDTEEDATLYLAAATLAKHAPGLDFVCAEDRRSTCFIGGYGRRYVASGAFLRTDRGIRRFSPREIACLLGFPDTLSFPANVSLENRYKLLGNSLSIPVARWVVQHL